MLYSCAAISWPPPSLKHSKPHHLEEGRRKKIEGAAVLHTRHRRQVQAGRYSRQWWLTWLFTLRLMCTAEPSALGFSSPAILPPSPSISAAERGKGSGCGFHPRLSRSSDPRVNEVPSPGLPAAPKRPTDPRAGALSFPSVFLTTSLLSYEPAKARGPSFLRPTGKGLPEEGLQRMRTVKRARPLEFCVY